MRWSAWHCSLQLTQPLPLKRGTLTTRDFLLLRFQDDQQSYWSEASPLPDWSLDTLNENLEACKDLTEFSSPHQALAQHKWPAALSSALGLLSTSPSTEKIVRSNQLLFDPTTALQPTAQSFKFKVGRHCVIETADQINLLSSRLSSQQSLRLDANQSWTVAQVRQLLALLIEPDKIEYIEEPLLPELNYQHWHEYCSIPFAYDERLLHTQPPLYEGLQAFIIKPTLLGWEKTQHLYDVSQQHNVKVILSSSFESPLMLSKLSALAQQWQLTEDQGLATDQYYLSTLSSGTWPLTDITIECQVL